jgi:hypothetical protein
VYLLAPVAIPNVEAKVAAFRISGKKLVILVQRKVKVAINSAAPKL